MLISFAFGVAAMIAVFGSQTRLNIVMRPIALRSR